MENGTVSRDEGDRGWAANCRDSRVFLSRDTSSGVNSEDDDEMFDLEPNDLQFADVITQDDSASSQGLQASETLESMAQRLKLSLIRRVRQLLSQRSFRKVQDILNAIICKGLAHEMLQSVAKGAGVGSAKIVAFEWSREKCHADAVAGTSIELLSQESEKSGGVGFSLLWSQVTVGPNDANGLRRELKNMVIQALVIRAQLSASLGGYY